LQDPNAQPRIADQVGVLGGVLDKAVGVVVQSRFIGRPANPVRPRAPSLIAEHCGRKAQHDASSHDGDLSWLRI
jgi:hypothetical protein